MNFKKRWISVLLICICLAAVILAGNSVWNTSTRTKGFISHKDTIHLWYTDERLTDYLNGKAVAYYDETDTRVELHLVSGLEYLEQINQASLDDATETPDVYIVTNDSLEKAYLAGLATEIQGTDMVDDTLRFPATARNAVTYKGKYIGYPFYFETAALLYNKTYLEEIAASVEEEIVAQDLIPGSIVDILNVADMYSTPENVEYFFRWDVSDIFYNYFFVGHYLTVGGEAGDDENTINIYNVGSVSSLKVYQEMNQFFSIDTDEITYESVMEDFIAGKTIYTIATGDCLESLESAKKAGNFAYEYGIAELPAINAELQTEGMSVTNAFVINGYSTKKDKANDLIRYILDEDKDCELFDMTGKLPVQAQDSYTNPYIKSFRENYETSVPIPKMLAASNFWIELEKCFAKVWDGEDANTEIREISEKIKTQILGEQVVEEVLPNPEIELLPAVEYEDSGELDG